MNIQKNFLQMVSIFFLAASVSKAASDGKETRLANANNDEKVRIMCHFPQPRRGGDILLQIRKVNILFPKRLKGNEFGEDDLVVRTSVVLSNFADNFARNKVFQTQEVATELVALLIKFNTAIKRTAIRNYKTRYPADMNVVAPRGSGIMNGGDPAEIEDAALHRQYLATIKRNDHNIASNNLQQTLRLNADNLKQPTRQMLRALDESSNFPSQPIRTQLAISYYQ